MWLAADIDFDKGAVLEFGLAPGQEPRRRCLVLHIKAIGRRWPGPPEIVAARERSLDNAHESAKQDFKAQWWRTDRALRWLAWRDPDRINDDWRPALRYQRGTVSDPQPALLRAVQDGTLVAHRHGRPMAPAEWARVELHHLPDVDFNREDVLRVFGEEAPLDAAICRRLPRTDAWKRFCDNVRRDLGIAAGTRGMSDRTIRRRAKQLKPST